MSLLLALSGHSDHFQRCPLSGVKRTFNWPVAMSAFDPKRTLAQLPLTTFLNYGTVARTSMWKAPMTAPDPSTELMQMINWYQVSQALHVAATLGVADQLKDGPKLYDVVAQTCGAHPASLYRLLRALAAVGVFHETSNKEFSLTPLGACLTGDATGSARNYA